jgi:hypothetical protein
MIPTLTMHLRFITRDEIIEQTATSATDRKVRVLQQFWAHPDGKDWVRDKDDPFLSVNGTWCDVPWVSK